MCLVVFLVVFFVFFFVGGSAPPISLSPRLLRITASDFTVLTAAVAILDFMILSLQMMVCLGILVHCLWKNFVVGFDHGLASIW